MYLNVKTCFIKTRLQKHQFQAYEIIDNFFSSEEDDELVAAGAQAAGGGGTAVQAGAGGPQAQQFVFQSTQQNVPDEGFSFQ
jgi:hypothetical protein